MYVDGFCIFGELSKTVQIMFSAVSECFIVGAKDGNTVFLLCGSYEAPSLWSGRRRHF